MAIDLKKVFEIPEALDTRSSMALIKAIKDNTVEGFEYIKYMHSVQSLLKMGLSEEQAYKSAFSTAQTMGFSKDVFEKSSAHYRSILRIQRESFAEALKRQRTDKINSRLKDKESYESKIQQNLAKIKKLKAENQVLKERLKNYDSDIQQEKEKMEGITEEFVKTYNHIEKKIQEDSELFVKYNH